MSTLSTRLNLVLPDDGGPGGDDTIDVTTQISNNFAALDDAVGLYQCLEATRPVLNNYNGRMIRCTDSNVIYEYRGGVWVGVFDSTGIFNCTSATRPTINLYTGKLILETDTGRIYRYDGGWKYLMHDPTAQYKPPFDLDTTPLVATVGGTISVFRSGPMVYVRMLNITFATSSAPNVLRSIITTPVGFRPAFATTGALVTQNNATAFAIWGIDGNVNIAPFATIPGGTFIHGMLVAPTLGYV